MSDDMKDRARQLVARYAEQGLGGMTGAEVRLLLGEKQRHLGEVSEHLVQRQGLIVNLHLKCALENEVREIGKHLEQPLFREWTEDYAAAKERDAQARREEKQAGHKAMLEGMGIVTGKDGRDQP